MAATTTLDQTEVSFSDINLDFFIESGHQLVTDFDKSRIPQAALQVLYEVQQGERDAIIPTVGLYPNGDTYHKKNGVRAENLLFHLVYNLAFRPGRTFFMNHVLVYEGTTDVETQLTRYRNQGLYEWKPTRDTQPYE
jgi:hypothetical protein